jgi:hypothetical protein
MKKNNHWLLVFLTASICIVADSVFAEEWSEVTNGVQVSICLATNQPVKSNQPVVILFKIRNTLTNELVNCFSGGSPETSCLFKITDPYGKAAPYNTHIIITGSLGCYRIAANEIREFPVNLSLLYEFNEVGKYKIFGKVLVESQAAMLSHPHTTFDENQAFTAISNPLEIEIVSGK